MDFHLVPPVCIIFILGFMHCINQVNVRVLGILPDLHFEGNAYIHTALQVFSISYIFVEIPNSIFLKSFVL